MCRNEDEDSRILSDTALPPEVYACISGVREKTMRAKQRNLEQQAKFMKDLDQSQPKQGKRQAGPPVNFSVNIGGTGQKPATAEVVVTSGEAAP